MREQFTEEPAGSAKGAAGADATHQAIDLAERANGQIRQTRIGKPIFRTVILPRPISFGVRFQNMLKVFESAALIPIPFRVVNSYQGGAEPFEPMRELQIYKTGRCDTRKIIAALRRKLDDETGPSRITTVRGVGFRLEEPRRGTPP